MPLVDTIVCNFSVHCSSACRTFSENWPNIVRKLRRSDSRQRTHRRHFISEWFCSPSPRGTFVEQATQTDCIHPIVDAQTSDVRAAEDVADIAQVVDEKEKVDPQGSSTLERKEGKPRKRGHKGGKRHRPPAITAAVAG